MRLGPPIIRTCTHCRGHISEHTMASGNTIDARLWTDGFRRAPMLPILPWLVACPHCHALVWITDLPKVESPRATDAPDGAGPGHDRLAEFQRWRETPFGLDPTPEQFRAVLDGPPLPRTRESHVRRNLWWAGNHARRDGTQRPPLSADETANLEAFAALQREDNQEQRIFKAEALRELGRFEEAAPLLVFDFSSRYQGVVARIRERLAARDPWVAEL